MKKIISSLINIDKEIRKCYLDLAKLEFNDNTDLNAIREIYSNIREYRLLEEHFYSKLSLICTNVENYNEVYAYISETYNVIDDVLFFEYINDLDSSIEARRIIIEFVKRFRFDDNDSFFKNDEMEDIEEELTECYSDLIFNSLIDEEDNVRFIRKIDKELESGITVDISKEKLCQIKYDIIFLSRSLEEMLVEDYSILSIPLVDAKSIASSLFGFTDEDIAQSYDFVRISDLLDMMEQLSQKKNENFDSLNNQLRFLLLDIWFESLDYRIVVNVLNEFEKIVNDSYNDDIYGRRNNVLEILNKRYVELIEKGLNKDKDVAKNKCNKANCNSTQKIMIVRKKKC